MSPSSARARISVRATGGCRQKCFGESCTTTVRSYSSPLCLQTLAVGVDEELSIVRRALMRSRSGVEFGSKEETGETEGVWSRKYGYDQVSYMAIHRAGIGMVRAADEGREGCC